MYKMRRKIIMAVCLLALGGLWGLLWLHLAHDRTQTLAAAETNASNLARAFEEHVSNSVRNFDNLLLHLREEYQRSPHWMSAHTGLMSRYTIPGVQIIQISVVNRQGIVIFGTIEMPSVPVDVSDREHFKVHAAGGPDQLFISKPLLGRTSKKWSIQFTRPLFDASGRFNGVIVLSVAPEYFSNFYKSVDIGPNGVVSLVGMDRIMRARTSPKGDDSVDPKGISVPGDRPFFDPAQPAAGIYRVPSVVDGVARVGAYRRLADYPLLVVVWLAEDDIFSRFNSRASTLYMAAALLSCLIMAAAWFLQRYEQRNTETLQKLADLNRNFLSLLENTTDFVYFKNKDSRFIFCSQPLARITGHASWRDMVGKHDLEVFPEETARIYIEEELPVFRDGQPLLNKIDPYYDEHGRKGWISTNKWPVFDQYGMVNGICGVSRDVSAQHRQELINQARLRLIEYSFEHTLGELLTRVLDEAELLTNSSIGFLHFVDDDGNKLCLQAWSSSTMEKFCKAEGKGQHYPLETAGVWADCAREKKPIIHNDYATLPGRKGLPDGHAPVLRELTVPLIRDERVVAIIGVGNSPLAYTDDDSENISRLADVTWEIVQSKRSMEALHAAKMAAEEANAAKSRFLATMSHELRTPLNGIIGMASLLLETALPGEQRTYTGIIRSSAFSLLEIISDVLEFSRLEAYKVELDIQPFNLAAELHETCAMLRHQAQQRGLDFAFNIVGNLPETLMGDAGRLRQVIINLVGNAIKFTTEGGIELVVQAGEVRDKRLEIGFSVADTGIGIPAAQCASIFEPFTQLDDSSVRKHGGAGLGLAICRDLVRMMGGEISVESMLGKGSTFRFSAVFCVPQQEHETIGFAGGMAQNESLPTKMRKNCRILVVEDDEINRIYIQALLTRLGQQCYLVENGLEAVEELEREEYDLVLMDCRMPVMNGFEATARIRDPASAVKNHGVPVLALTANAMKEDQDLCIAAGMNGYLAKPFELSELAEILDRMLAGGDAYGSLPLKAVEPDAAGAIEAPAAASLVFDRSALERRLMHSRELLQTFIAMFLDEIPKKLEGIYAALAAGDDSAVILHAHTIKGLAANCGAGFLHDAAFSVEQSAASGNLEAVRMLLPELELRFRQVVEEMEPMAQ